MAYNKPQDGNKQMSAFYGQYTTLNIQGIDMEGEFNTQTTLEVPTQPKPMSYSLYEPSNCY